MQQMTLAQALEYRFETHVLYLNPIFHTTLNISPVTLLYFFTPLQVFDRVHTSASV